MSVLLGTYSLKGVAPLSSGMELKRDTAYPAKIES